MPNNPLDPTTNLADHLLEQETRDREAIAILLDRFLGKDDRLLVQKTEMGNTNAYLGSATLEWLNNRVRYASQLPLFRQKFDYETGNVIRDAETIEDIQQRPLDWSRQAPLAQYLAVREHHKFPALLVVVSPEWVDDPYALQWNEEGRATQSATDFTPLDKTGTLGLLNVAKGVSIFALDGQHRLMGVQGLIELINTGSLQRLNKKKAPTGGFITVDELMKEYNLNSARLQSLAYEQIGIEFIPAVVQGETRDEARRRVRSIFVHVNLMAVRLSKGQLALLDEDNGFAIVARKVAVTHPLLEDREERSPRVNWDSATVAAKSTVLTTLQALQDMSERYLGYRFSHWNSDKKNLVPMRPDDEELDEGLEAFKELFNYLATLPSYQKLDRGTNTPELRRFSHEKEGGEGNLLFRPVGQIALAQALGYLVTRRGLPLGELFEKLCQYDVEGGFSGMEHPQSLWYGVLYDPNKQRVLVAGRDLAARLLIYLLGEIQDDFERAELRRDFVEARTINNQTINFEGKFVDNPRAIDLPLIL